MDGRFLRLGATPGRWSERGTGRRQVRSHQPCTHASAMLPLAPPQRAAPFPVQPVSAHTSSARPKTVKNTTATLRHGPGRRSHPHPGHIPPSEPRRHGRSRHDQPPFRRASLLGNPGRRSLTDPALSHPSTRQPRARRHITPANRASGEGQLLPIKPTPQRERRRPDALLIPQDGRRRDQHPLRTMQLLMPPRRSLTRRTPTREHDSTPPRDETRRHNDAHDRHHEADNTSSTHRARVTPHRIRPTGRHLPEPSACETHLLIEIRVATREPRARPTTRIALQPRRLSHCHHAVALLVSTLALTLPSVPEPSLR